MTLDEAIKIYEMGAKRTWNGRLTIYAEQCQQMVEWLKELKAHREAWENCIKEIKEWYWNSDKQSIAKDPCAVDAMVDLFIRTIKECRPKEGYEMTRDELLERGDETVTLRQLVERFEAVEKEYRGMPWSLKQIYTQIDMLVSEKPCGDAISRQAVLDLIFIPMPELTRKINELPTVTPQPKMGHWEWNQYDANPKIGNFHCSLCHMIGRAYYDYCPTCGAKMSEIPTGEEGSEE